MSEPEEFASSFCFVLGFVFLFFTALAFGIYFQQLPLVLGGFCAVFSVVFFKLMFSFSAAAARKKAEAKKANPQSDIRNPQ